MCLWEINRLPVRICGKSSLCLICSLIEPLHTMVRIGLKQVELFPPRMGHRTYTIDGITATGYEFMYGRNRSPDHRAR